MHLLVLDLCLLSILPGHAQPQALSPAEQDYLLYHRQIATAHQAIARQRYEEALAGYERVFDQYRFVFRRDYQAATQLALQVGRPDKAFTYLRKGIVGGWDWKAIKKNNFLKPLAGDPEWKKLKQEYARLQRQHRAKLNPDVRKTVKNMFGKDQRKALGALLHFSSKGQDRYAEKRFAPHSEKQLARLGRIIRTHGYPGEQLIGNGQWATVILSHHNSISEAYARQDTLYPSLKAHLWKALKAGQLSAYDFAKMEEWRVTVKSGHKEKHAGYLSETLSRQERDKADQIRAELGLSSVETINGLLAIQQQTGMNFYLPLHTPQQTKIIP